MFSAWGDFAYRHRRVVPAVVIATILALYLIFGMSLDDKLSQEGWDDPASSSSTAALIEEQTFGRDSSGDVILLFSSTGGIAQSAEFTTIASYLDDLKQKYPDQIETIDSYFDKRNPKLVSADGTTAFAAIALKGDDEQTLKDFRTIQPDLHPTFTGVTVQVAGATAVADALDAGMSRDIQRAELVALPMVAVLLLFVFGSVVAAFMPLIVGGLSILGSLGTLAVLASFTQVNVFAHSVVTLLGLGLAIDYGLFMVSRFREELDQGRPVAEAVRLTTATAGKTVVFSAAMVAVALSGLLIFPQAFLKSVAYGAISAVGLAALLSVTVLPSLFGLLGHRIDSLTVRRTSRRTRRLKSTWWYRLPTFAMRRATLVTVAGVAGLIALTVPLVGVKFGGINETYLPPNNDVRQAQNLFDAEFPEFRTEPIKLVVTNASNDQLVAIYQQANTIKGLSGYFTPSSPTKDGTTVLSAGIVDRANNEYVVNQLRALQVPDGVSVYIGGTPKLREFSKPRKLSIVASAELAVFSLTKTATGPVNLLVDAATVTGLPPPLMLPPEITTSEVPIRDLKLITGPSGNSELKPASMGPISPPLLSRKSTITPHAFLVLAARPSAIMSAYCWVTSLFPIPGTTTVTIRSLSVTVGIMVSSALACPLCSGGTRLECLPPPALSTLRIIG